MEPIECTYTREDMRAAFQAGRDHDIWVDSPNHKRSVMTPDFPSFMLQNHPEDRTDVYVLVYKMGDEEVIAEFAADTQVQAIQQARDIMSSRVGEVTYFDLTKLVPDGS